MATSSQDLAQNPALASGALDQLFRDARSHNVWTDTAVTREDMIAIYDLMKMGPTSANTCPARFVFVSSDAGKARLKPFVAEGNVDKVMQAPVTVIIGFDLGFADKMDVLFPHNPDAKNWFSDPAVEEATAFRNGTLQAGYLIMAARALGFDCGPMSGFDQAGVDKEFFAGTRIKSNFICSIGVGDPAGVYPRSPRLPFDDAAKVL